MQNDASNARQLVVDRIRQSTNILVAVSANPSVDALAAALGLALMLNKMDKHATAVFSGAIPPAMEFLNPGKTFENSVDSLRDFIISLDKEKADRLRYKVEDDVVRIFITPYRTVIGEKDLQFSQGDFNVDLILSLGVEKREDLDKAIIAHGRILHDATVMTLNIENRQSSLGVVDWHEAESSSLCEMLVTLAESLQQPGLVDAQIATALLTGIVAATDRFSNQHTTPRIMTMAAQLMAAGANQQLIANNLVKARELPEVPNNGELVPGAQSIRVAEPAEEKPKEPGELDINHPKAPQAPVAAMPPSIPVVPPPAESPAKFGKNNRNKRQRQQNAEQTLAEALPSAAAATSAFDDLKQAIENETPSGGATEERKAPGSEDVNGSDEEKSKEDKGYVVGNSSWRGRRLEPPALGGVLNATTEQAMDDTLKAEEDERNKKLLTHPDAPMNNKGKTIEPPKEASPEPPAPKQKAAKPAEPTLEPKPESETSATEQPAVPELPPTLQAIEDPILPPQPEPVAVSEPAPTPEPKSEPSPELLPASAPKPAAEPVAPALPPVPELPPLPTAVPESQPTTPAETTPAAAPAPTESAALDAARQAVDDALASQPFNPAGQPLQSTGALPLGPDPNANPATTIVPPPAEPTPAAAPAPALPDVGLSALPPLPPMPPLPQQDPNQPLPPPPSLSDLPPLPGDIPPAPVGPVTPPTPTAPSAPQTPAAPSDPKQFQIPGA
ncbi:MAG TPA: hypothetical protein VLG40_00225 [Candidatus Saccharimonas sp.]|nr:hypothetical protein [Candidatus Saccharimonas sp.]